jgi:3-deoxy-manno-octulosonate cytidylyltransferase (CMP-KDO synthetase)
MPAGDAVTIVIPARFASTRYPAKPLAMIRGASGVAKPLVQRSYEAACQVAGASVVVATDDDSIAAAAHAFGAPVVMTPAACANGTQLQFRHCRNQATSSSIFRATRC